MGASPYLLAFPATRQRVPLDPEREAVGPRRLGDEVGGKDEKEIDAMEGLDAIEGFDAMESIDEVAQDLQE